MSSQDSKKKEEFDTKACDKFAKTNANVAKIAAKSLKIVANSLKFAKNMWQLQGTVLWAP